MRIVHGRDVSYSRLTKEWVAGRVAEGVEIIVQDVWTGGYLNNGTLNALAPGNLRAIREGGAIPAIYANAAIWRTPQIWFDESVKNAGTELQYVKLVVIDIEIKEGNDVIDPALVWEFIKLWEDAGFTVWTYSGDWYVGFWKLQLGNANLVNFNRPYWYAAYDGKAVIGQPFHPLGPVAGKQYGWKDEEGVTVDLNVFNSDYIPGLGAPVEENDIMANLTDAEVQMFKTLLPKLVEHFVTPIGPMVPYTGPEGTYPGREGFTRAFVSFLSDEYLDSVHLRRVFELFSKAGHTSGRIWAISTGGQPTVWAIEVLGDAIVKRSVTDPETFGALGGDWGSILFWTPEILAKIPEAPKIKLGNPIPPASIGAAVDVPALIAGLVKALTESPTFLAAVAKTSNEDEARRLLS